ncbi:MAG: hypothetical protein J7M34_13080, partial [Anaerolineae bacterium]|nr:hypothetical protein [Anaerolineae bacterium]
MAVIVLSLLSIAWDSELPPIIKYPNGPPQAGWTWFGGLIQREECADGIFFIYAGSDTDGELLGQAQAEMDPFGSATYFYSYLSRPLEEGETITVCAECGQNTTVRDTFTVIPFQSQPNPLYIRRDPHATLYGSYPIRSLAGATSFEGRLPQVCAGRVAHLYLGSGPDGELLGSSIVQSDGSFRMKLRHPLEADSMITVYSDCSILENVPVGEYLY